MELFQTPLYDLCLKSGCRIVPFAGWEMPIQFSGLVNEHLAVRKKAGLFDISHMGVIRLEGSNPKDALQTLVPSDLNRIAPGEACYTVLLNEKGGIIDDLIVYDTGSDNSNQESLLLVINAACSKTDIDWLRRHLEPKGISITDAKQNGVLLALQGPQANEILEKVCNESLAGLPKFGHRQIQIKGIPGENATSIFVARTGYTGEDGFEVLLSANAGQALWKRLIQEGVTPCGLGARDTLRLEAAMLLYGNDIGPDTTPFEAGLGWLVHLEMPSNFVGRSILEKQASEGIKKRLVGLKVTGRAIARQSYQIFYENKHVGLITSGTWSPSLQEGIALAYVPTELGKLGTTLNIEIRDKLHIATVVKRPFYRRN